MALNLIGTWDDWIKRRVESIELVSETTVLRKVSVDFRLHPWLPEPVVTFDGHGVHYVPIALLNKGPLLEFDTRDETGRALPLLTLRKCSAIAAATLASLAQLLVWLELKSSVGEARLNIGDDFPPDPLLIRLPGVVEDEFMRISHLPYQGEFGSRNRLLEFLDGSPARALRPVSWGWSCGDDGLWFTDVGEEVWRYELARHAKMRKLLEDFSRVWMVSVPVKHADGDRRIIKFSYFEHRMEPQVRLVNWAKLRAGKRASAWLGHAEDWLEGLPHDTEHREWRSRQSAYLVPDPVSLRTKICQALAWHGHSIVFEVPAVGEGGSYHLELLAPDGTQIRRATLAIIKPGTSIDASLGDPSIGQSIAGSEGALRTPQDGDPAEHSDLDAIRGARSLQRAHLYVGDVAAGARGEATVTLKPRSSAIVRSLALLASAAFVMLLLSRLKLDALIDRDDGAALRLAPFFLLIPGLGAAAVARGSEHAMATSMLFGMRLLAIAVAADPIVGASLLAEASHWPHLRTVWTLLVVFSAVLMLLTLTTWRLTSRRRPDGTVP